MTVGLPRWCLVIIVSEGLAQGQCAVSAIGEARQNKCSLRYRLIAETNQALTYTRKH